MTRLGIITAAAALSLPIATPAMADTAQLRYQDLNLSTDAGMAELSLRIDRVAQRACPAETLTGSRLRQTEDQQRCIADVKRQIQTRLAAKPGGALAASRQQGAAHD